MLSPIAAPCSDIDQEVPTRHNDDYQKHHYDIYFTLAIAVNMMHASSSPLGSKAHCSYSVAIGGAWAAGCATTRGECKQMGYAPASPGADADVQLAGHSLQVHARVQLSIQPDGFSASRFRRRSI